MIFHTRKWHWHYYTQAQNTLKPTTLSDSNTHTHTFYIFLQNQVKQVACVIVRICPGQKAVKRNSWITKMLVSIFTTIWLNQWLQSALNWKENQLTYLGRKQVKGTVFQEFLYLLHDSYKFSNTSNILK